MFKSIYFYNNFNNGDVHLSRGFVKFALENIALLKNIPVFFGHRNYHKILADLNVTTQPGEYANRHGSGFFNNQNNKHFIHDDVLYINTWYGSDNYNYMNRYGLNFDCLYHVFRDTFIECFNVDLNNYDVKKVFPQINFEQFYTINAENWIRPRDHEFKVFISNGLVQSGQANNIGWNPVIDILADRFHGVSFLVTNKVDYIINRNNVFYTEDIIKKGENDLNENAYLSTKSQIIIGRASGASTFATNTVNMFERKCDSISFADFDTQHKNFWFGDHFKDKINLTCNLTNYKNQNLDFIIETVSDLIKKRG
jgi:hypothetical protein